MPLAVSPSAEKMQPPNVANGSTKDIDDALDADSVAVPFQRGVSGKYVLYPIQELKLWTMYKTAQTNFWTAEDFARRGNDNKAPNTFQVFGAMYTLLGEIGLHPDTSLDTVAIRVEHQEAKMFLNYQAMMRNIHIESYGNLLYHLSTGCTISDLATIENALISPTRRVWLAQQQYLYGGGSIGIVAAACADSVFFSTFGLIAGLADSTSLADKIAIDKDATIEFLAEMCARSSTKEILPAIRYIVQEALQIELAAIDDTGNISSGSRSGPPHGR
ncbi:hypothetical protein B0H16DRAFT_1495418 [Mycena metata]|uniref:Uncharacterized protein n=1 Tax=Mycena metata TaxID=1033252 RepID=A0AAD7P0U7_9AGAR|nr:hypothetical protein B0H16DRAFT_1495418 [Mycena metata]